MATINLGSIKFNWKGAYSGATAYVVDDVVESSGSSYICIAATTGNAPPNATYWEQMSSAGTNGTDGTDLGTTLTTQGDIVYRDASGLARLPAGSANQVLQSGGTGANPSWGTVSSDFVKLASTEITSNTQAIDLDGYFSSDYEVYKIIGKGLGASNYPTDNMRFRMLQSGTTYSATDYYATIGAVYTDGSNNNFDNTRDVGRNYARIANWYISNNDESHFELNIYNPQDTSKRMTWHSDFFVNYSNANYWARGWGGGWINSSSASFTGIQISLDSGASYTKGTFTLYGIK